MKKYRKEDLIERKSFVVSDNKIKTVVMEASVRVSATFMLSPFAIQHLLHGYSAQWLAREADTNSVHPYVVDYMKLVAQLIKATDTPNLMIKLERGQVLILRKWIEARMTNYVEEEEDFDSNVYLDLKMLLLDIKEWFMAEPSDDKS